ncbi:MAG: hypothetical protein B6242_06190 [Anaerolineaceae bacterium 4572_78]|nr:MAG: hypothetical protein B6242_06190 [Anaerolineaceae bacterium 4572_78]
MRIVIMRQSNLYAEGLENGKYIGSKWGGKYLRAPNIFFTILRKDKDVLVPLKDVANIIAGIITGANSFFYLTQTDIKAWEIEEKYLISTVKTPKELKTISFSRHDLRQKILYVEGRKNELDKTNVLEYILKHGESKNIHLRRSFENRDPMHWYKVRLKKARLLWVDLRGDKHVCHYNQDYLP